MRGFLILAGLYAGVWAVLLLPGAYVLLRRTGEVPVPDDDPDPFLWIGRLRRELVRRAPDAPVASSDVPVADARAKLKVSDDALRVRGSLDVGEGAAVVVGLIVDGDLRCAQGSRLLAPVWVRGRAAFAEGCQAVSIVADGGLRLGPEARVTGSVAARGEVRLEAGAQVAGAVISRRSVVLAPGAIAGSAIAPSVRGAAPPADVDVAPRAAVEPLADSDWPDELDDVLDELWAAGRLDELVEEISVRTGTEVRGRDILRRARELGLYERGIPRRPTFLGRRPAWVLTPEVVRVGADLRISPEERVGYSLVVEGALEVFHDAELEAPVRTGRGLLLHQGAVVHGSAVSDGLIVCEEGAVILGPADSSMHILLFANSRIGTTGQGGAHARGAIGLEPGAEILGGASAGLGVRGEALRPAELRVEPPAEEPEARPRRRRRRRQRQAQEAETAETSKPKPPKKTTKKKRRRRRRRKPAASKTAERADA